MSAHHCMVAKPANATHAQQPYLCFVHVCVGLPSLFHPHTQTVHCLTAKLCFIASTVQAQLAAMGSIALSRVSTGSASRWLNLSGHGCRWTLPMRILPERKSARLLHCMLLSSRQMQRSLARGTPKLCRHSNSRPGHPMSNLLVCVWWLDHRKAVEDDACCCKDLINIGVLQ